MKAGAGKRKGSQFERDFARQLSNWWTFNADPDVFWRTSGSGARHGVREEAGDIKNIKPVGATLTDNIMFELKHWNEPNLILDMMRVNKVSKLYNAWVKCYDQAQANNKHPFMIVKITNATTICIFCDNDAMIPWLDILRYVAIHIPALGVYIIEWDQFLKTDNMFRTLREKSKEVL